MLFMLEVGKIIREMDMDYNIGLQELSMKGNGRMIRLMDKED